MPEKAARLPSTKRLRMKDDEERPRFGKLERPVETEEQYGLQVTGNQIPRNTIEMANNTTEEGEIVVTDMQAEQWLLKREGS
mmetsp:Transcript_26690/g.40715  ORF Transcript_26690/g.40715 Transcript_26690/m.40715 type:complete len:82 (+) Transcript_26690:327-572(+)